MELDFFVVLFYGLLIGSFLNVVILRLPGKQDLVMERSHCPKCNKKIYWYENIPVISYLFLRGKCSGCKTGISMRYPFVELLSGLGTLYIYSRFTPSGDILTWSLFIFLCLFFYILICHFFIDIDHQILPDSLNLILLALALLIMVPRTQYYYWIYGGLLGFGSTFLITYLFYKFRGKVGLGGGDIKLYGILGIMLGPIGIFQNIFLSCMLGTVVILSMIGLKKMKSSQPVAFGPSIILVGVFQIYFPRYFNVLMGLIGQ